MGSYAFILQNVGGMSTYRDYNCPLDKKGTLECMQFASKVSCVFNASCSDSVFDNLICSLCSSPFSAVIANISLVEKYGKLERHIIA